MASALQCPACGHKHRLSELTGDPIFACEQCGRLLKTPDRVPPARAVGAGRAAAPERSRRGCSAAAPPRRDQTSVIRPRRRAGAGRAAPRPRQAARRRSRRSRPRARRRPPGHARRCRCMILGWVVALVLGGVIVRCFAKITGLLTGDSVIDLITGSGFGRYLRLFARRAVLGARDRRAHDALHRGRRRWQARQQTGRRPSTKRPSAVPTQPRRAPGATSARAGRPAARTEPEPAPATERADAAPAPSAAESRSPAGAASRPAAAPHPQARHLAPSYDGSAQRQSSGGRGRRRPRARASAATAASSSSSLALDRTGCRGGAGVVGQAEPAVLERDDAAIGQHLEARGRAAAPQAAPSGSATSREDGELVAHRGRGLVTSARAAIEPRRGARSSRRVDAASASTGVSGDRVERRRVDARTAPLRGARSARVGERSEVASPSAVLDGARRPSPADVGRRPSRTRATASPCARRLKRGRARGSSRALADRASRSSAHSIQSIDCGLAQQLRDDLAPGSPWKCARIRARRLVGAPDVEDLAPAVAEPVDARAARDAGGEPQLVRRRVRAQPRAARAGRRARARRGCRPARAARGAPRRSRRRRRSARWHGSTATREVVGERRELEVGRPRRGRAGGRCASVSTRTVVEAVGRRGASSAASRKLVSKRKLCPTSTASPMNSSSAGRTSSIARRGQHHRLGDAGEHGDERRDRHARVHERVERPEALAAAVLHRADLGDRVVVRRGAGGLEVERRRT